MDTNNNSSTKIYTDTYKNEESIVMENSKYKVVILPNLGGKIASIYYKPNKFELLYQYEFDKYNKPNFYDKFAAYDSSGFDDCYPSIDQSVEFYSGEKIEYPDHGDIWFRPFNSIIENNKVILQTDSTLMDYTFIKTLHLDLDGLLIDYTIKNTGNVSIEGFYTLHCLVNCHPDMIIHFPKEVTSVINVADGTVLGEEGKVHQYPLTKDLEGNPYRLDRVEPVASNKVKKYYATQPVLEGKCSIDYPHKNVKFILEYDANKLPYLGFWVNEGGFKGNYNCAFEPSNGFYDSMVKARKNNAFHKLLPKSEFNFSLYFALKNM